MPNDILELIRTNRPKQEIITYVELKKEKVPLFSPLKELNNKTLFQHLMLYEKIYHWTLAHFISSKIVDFQEISEEGTDLMQSLLIVDDLPNFQNLLLAGQKPTETLFSDSLGTKIGNFLRYKPGKNNPMVYDLSIQRIPNIVQLHNLMYDFLETSDEESSDAELSDIEELTQEQLIAYKENQNNVVAHYNSTGEGVELLSLVAARGVHFVQRHFPKTARTLVHETKHEPHTTYSFSTLHDSGYDADAEPEEDDESIVEIHQRNLQFIDTLKNTADKKEKPTGNRKPPASRNNRVFDNLFWREIQAYINSYDTSFNLRGIQINFDFESPNNPHLSLSWKTDVAGMYGGGVRFGWKRGDRRDPHYRRFDGKPKHPNVGYIDVFEFPLEYVRANGVDRLLAYNARAIDLSNIHLAEAEVIFHSMIPKEYHVRRYIVTLPSFSKLKSEGSVEEIHYGMNGSGSYTRARNGFFSATNQKRKDASYQEWVTARTEHAVKAQSVLIDKATDLSLFTKGKVRVFDHGTGVSLTLPTPNH